MKSVIMKKEIEREIGRILREKDRGIVSKEMAVRKILRALQKDVRAEIAEAAIGSWDAHYLPKMLSAIDAMVKSTGNELKNIAKEGMDEMIGKGHDMVDIPLDRGGIYVSMPRMSPTVMDAFQDFAFHKLDDVSQAAFEKIRTELTMGILGQKTPQEVAGAIGKNLKDPSVFRSIAQRAETITQTEMGRVFSKATQSRMEEAAEYVERLEKEWRHVGHPKVPRASHLAAHGEHVPVNEPFSIGGVSMMFPRDPGAPIEEVIHCG
ncbi:MAG: hypothetical protein SVY10_18990 [Thermodesulfobacteriota bacterium]|nr:hypothetical protein [Thermodesulfobacteriota bacterium]